LGLDAFKLFGTYNGVVFHLSMFLGGALQLTMYGILLFLNLPKNYATLIKQYETVFLQIS
jgi:hypothetical protein